MRDDEPAPAIARDYDHNRDRDVRVISTPYDSVSFTRGMGDSGYTLEVVEHKCPSCGFDRMFRQHRVYPEDRDRVKYWCLSAHCRHYLRDMFSYARPRRARETHTHE